MSRSWCTYSTTSSRWAPRGIENAWRSRDGKVCRLEALETGDGSAGLEVRILADEPGPSAGDVKAVGALDSMLELIDRRLHELVDLADGVRVGVTVEVSARPMASE